MVQPSKNFPPLAPEPKAQRDRRIRQKAMNREVAMLDAVGAYLEGVGWRCVVASADRIQKLPEGEFLFEFVVRFTGSEKQAAH